jgi:PHD/YefM family antitoxin component YafN of YafNO toxin-antitoxin module
VDDSGKKKAVIIDLEEWGELWEDIYDILISEQRRGEPSVQLEELKAEALREERHGSDVYGRIP